MYLDFYSPTTEVKQNILTLFAAHHFLFINPRGAKIAGVLGISTRELYDLVERPEWKMALQFWGAEKPNMKPKGYNNRSRNRRQKAQSRKGDLFDKQKGICNGCRKNFTFEELTIDHITPLSKQGTNDRENLQLLCHDCNNLKADGNMEKLIALLVEKEVLTA